MILLYLAIAYFSGISLGRWAWAYDLLGCATPSWVWMVLAAALPFTPLLNRFRPTSHAVAAMCWPASAGFMPPRSPVSPALVAAIALCVLAGFFRFASRPLMPCWTAADLAYYNLPAERAFDRSAPTTTVEGYISDYPLIENTKQRLEITVDAVAAGSARQAAHGVVRLTTGIRQRYQYGQAVRVEGRLVTPPVFDTFSYREYLARKGVHSLMYGARIRAIDGPAHGTWIQRQLYGLRAQGEALLNRTLPEPHAALANGILLGIDAGIPDDLYEKFNLTGTSHVIVISGSNVAIIVAALMAIFQRALGRRRAIYPTLAGIGCYALLVGGDAAVMRAALMGGLVVLAGALNRRSTALVSLAAACWAMTLINPLMLWDVGFQLSSMATASLILFTPAVTGLFARLWPGFQAGPLTADQPADPAPDDTGAGVKGVGKNLLHGLVADGLIVTLAANVLVLPLVVYYFHRLSVVSLLTNLVIVPVQPLILLWGSLGIVIGMVGLQPLAQALLWVAWLGLLWTVHAVEWSARLPGASVEVATFGAAGLMAVYGTVAMLRWRAPMMRGLQRVAGWVGHDWQRRLLQPATLGILAVATLLIWSAALSQPDGRLHVHFLNIGQGDGIFIQTPSGRQVLVDGGSEPQRLFGQLGAVMPFWDRSVDLVVLTHPDGDHMNAQAELPLRYAVSHALDTAISQENPDAEPWRARMAGQGAAVHLQHAGGWIDLGDGVSLWVLWPPPGGFESEDRDNENSLVLKLVYGQFSALLTGDAGLAAEATWLVEGTPVAASVLKVGHHGSNSGSGAPFVAAADPQVAVIQVGADNTYGHPTAEVLEKLGGRLVLRNDLHGTIHLASDGQHLWVDAETGTPVGPMLESR